MDSIESSPKHHHHHHHHSKKHSSHHLHTHHHGRKRQKASNENEAIISNAENQSPNFKYDSDLIKEYYQNQTSSLAPITATCVRSKTQPTTLSSMSTKLNQESTSNDITSSLWGPPRVVVLHREPNRSLGIFLN